jgi:hypothetical protein
MAKEPSSKELHLDAWSRFERAVDVVAKSPPQHRTKEKGEASRKKLPKKRKSSQK